MTRPLVPAGRLRRLRRLRRLVLARRRPLAAACAAVAVVATVQATHAPPPARTLVLTAAHDLPGGVVVGADDVHRTPWDPATVPAGTLPGAEAVVGRTTAGPVRSGEPLTDARLVSRSLLRGYPGLVAVPLRVGDPGAVRLLRVGDRVDLLAADPQGEQPADTLGQGVPVLAIPGPDEASGSPTPGALVVVGLPEASVTRVAQASVSRFLSVALRR